MLPTWTPTVFWLMNRRSPISRFVRPAGDQRQHLELALGQAEGVAGRGPGCPPPGAVDAAAASAIGPGVTTGRGTDGAGAGSASSSSTAAGSWISARPASWRSARRSGRAWRRSASSTAAASGSRASARTTRASVRVLRPRDARGRTAQDRLGLPPAGAALPVRVAEVVPPTGELRPTSPDRRGPAAGRGTRAPSRGWRRARLRPRAVVVDPRPRDRGVGLREDPSGSLARCGDVADPSLLEGLGHDRGLDLERGRRHAGHQDPVLGAAHAGPAALGGPPRVGEVAAPHRVRRRRLVGRHRELEVAAGLELDEHAARAAGPPPRPPRTRSRR